MTPPDKIKGLMVVLKINGEWREVLLSDSVRREILSIVNKPTATITLIDKPIKL